MPFCFHKCHYCDFYSVVDTQDRQPAFLERLLDELEAARPWLVRPLETIFVGGGTPTLLAPALWERLLCSIATLATDRTVLEFTVEANPETVDDALLATLAAGGVNRLSLGAQSFNPAHLAMLERHHRPESVVRAVDCARKTGFRNINLDLIFGIPGQTVEEWKSDLDRAIALGPEHMSCYGLTYEPGTPLTARRDEGRVVPADCEVEALMYEHAIDRLAAAGFEQYEISNWARPNNRCRHNLLYWTNAQWWPLGPAAAGHAGGWRWKNAPGLTRYIEGRGLCPVIDAERPEEDVRVGEAFMLGLRLMDGLHDTEVEGLLSRGRRGAERERAIRRLVGEGLLEREDRRLRLTRRGLLVADSVIGELL